MENKENNLENSLKNLSKEMQIRNKYIERNKQIGNNNTAGILAVFTGGMLSCVYWALGGAEHIEMPQPLRDGLNIAGQIGLYSCFALMPLIGGYSIFKIKRNIQRVSEEISQLRERMY